jgi:hypothetical protein
VGLSFEQWSGAYLTILVERQGYMQVQVKAPLPDKGKAARVEIYRQRPGSQYTMGPILAAAAVPLDEAGLLFSTGKADDFDIAGTIQRLTPAKLNELLAGHWPKILIRV